VGLIYQATVWAKAESVPVTIYCDELVKPNDPYEIPLFCDYPWSDVMLAKKASALTGRLN
jgi:hypothetical protein